MSLELRIEWPAWRLVIEGVASVWELESVWNTEDVMKANAALDMRRDYEVAQQQAGQEK